MQSKVRIVQRLPSDIAVLLPIPRDEWISIADYSESLVSKEEAVEIRKSAAQISPSLDAPSIIPLWTGKRLVVIALFGKRKELSARSVRDAAMNIPAQLKALGLFEAAVMCTALDKVQKRALVEGVALGGYMYDEWRGALFESENKKKKKLVSFVFSSKDAAMPRKNLDAICSAVALTKDLVNCPPASANPDMLEKTARAIAKKFSSMRVRVLGERELKAEGLNGILAVGRGSECKPRLILLDYAPVKGQPLLLVGKGVTFDSGGLNLKPSKSLRGMKQDLGGAAVVLGSLQCIAELGIKRRVVAALPAVENSVDARSYRPDDVIRMSNGVTVEVTDTDAEGRIILGDTIAYCAEKYAPSAIIDLASLTGGSIVTAGDDIAVVMGTDKKLVASVFEAGREADEPLLELPLHEQYKPLLKSSIADIVNYTADIRASAIQGGLFLQHFVPEKTPWCHLDIAPVVYDDKKNLASGRMVRTVVNLLSCIAV